MELLSFLLRHCCEYLSALKTIVLRVSQSGRFSFVGLHSCPESLSHIHVSLVLGGTKAIASLRARPRLFARIAVSGCMLAKPYGRTGQAVHG